MIIAMVAVTFTSCKKGENDPFVSLKSRTGRISRDWTLSSASFTITTSGSYSGVTYKSVETYTFSGTTMTVSTTTTIAGSTSTDTDVYTYSDKITFDKKGTFTQTIVKDTVSTTNAGVWAFVLGNKDLELKKKEAIILTNTSGTGYSIVGAPMSPDQMLVLDKLSSKEMIVIFDYTETFDDDVTTYSGTMTYTAE